MNDLIDDVFVEDEVLEADGIKFVKERNEYVSNIVRTTHTIAQLKNDNQNIDEQKTALIAHIKNLSNLYKGHPVFEGKEGREQSWLYFSIFLNNIDFLTMSRLSQEKGLEQIKKIYMDK